MTKQTKPVKLSPTQQEVVNLMGDGWTLRSSRDAFGGRLKGSASVQKGDEYRQITRAVVAPLYAKGVIDGKRGDTFTVTDWYLTELGKSLAKPIETAPAAVWWYVRKYDMEPTAVEVDHSTDMTVTVKGRREDKSTDYATYYPTREAALAAIRHRLESAVRSAESALQAARESLAGF